MAIYKDVEPIIKWLEESISFYGEPTIPHQPLSFGLKTMLVKVLRTIKEEPTADVVEVARCKDCKFCTKIEWKDAAPTYYCDFCMSQVIPEGSVGESLYSVGEFFCGIGEKK